MGISLTFILLAVLAIVFVINRAVVSSIETMRRPSEVLEVVNEIDDPGFQAAREAFTAWAEPRGFIFECNFLSHTLNDGKAIQCAAWWSDSQNTWAVVYYANGLVNIDFVTRYSDTLGVTTASTKDAMTLPNRTTAYTQAFTLLDNDELYARHQEACSRVEAAERISPLLKQDLMGEVEKSMLYQVEYVTSLPLWRMRGVYWFFGRRNLKVNKPITVASA
ncbi:hypothetical protein [Marinobacterium stanieri]|uniref:hypothetical protein n=1 Tax=Marinobacterium stanieri TaxID=49186 RepID=UPI003A8F7450